MQEGYSHFDKSGLFSRRFPPQACKKKDACTGTDITTQYTAENMSGRKGEDQLV